VELWLIGFLKEPNENTNYAFDSELVRKRDRAKEAVNSVPTKTQKQLQLEKAVRIALQQDSWYTDMASQDAELQAYKDAGVKRVRWNIYGDDKVCAKCESMNGNVYDIDKVPKRPHLRCRCYLFPVN
jgi:SPP1 gp7 family putative phage head morphogenesis protein